MVENLDLALLLGVFGVHENQQIEGRTRIQKEICILKYRDNFPINFDFKPYYYGPYSAELTESIDTLVGMNLLQEDIIPIDYNTFRYDYKLTEQGTTLFNKIKAEDTELIERLQGIIGELEQEGTPDLVKLAKKVSGIPSVSEI